MLIEMGVRWFTAPRSEPSMLADSARASFMFAGTCVSVSLHELFSHAAQGLMHIYIHEAR